MVVGAAPQGGPDGVEKYQNARISGVLSEGSKILSSFAFECNSVWAFFCWLALC
jgi:hypothetical protein